MRKKTIVLSAAVLMAAASPHVSKAQPMSHVDAVSVAKRPPAGHYAWDAGRKRWVYVRHADGDRSHAKKDAWWNRHREGSHYRKERAWFRSNKEGHHKHHKHHPRGHAYGHAYGHDKTQGNNGLGKNRLWK